MQAKSSAEDFRAKCNGLVCDPSASGVYDTYASQSTMASALYVGGGVLAAAGGALLWFGASPDEAKPRGLRVQIAPQSVSLGGSF